MLTKEERDKILKDLEGEEISTSVLAFISKLVATCDELEECLKIGERFDDAQILKANAEIERLRSLCREASKHLAIYLDDLCVSGCGECDTCVLWRLLKEEGEKP